MTEIRLLRAYRRRKDVEAMSLVTGILDPDLITYPESSGRRKGCRTTLPHWLAPLGPQITTRLSPTQYRDICSPEFLFTDTAALPIDRIRNFFRSLGISEEEQWKSADHMVEAPLQYSRAGST